MVEVPTQSVRDTVRVGFLQTPGVIITERAIEEIPGRVVGKAYPPISIIIVSPIHRSERLIGRDVRIRIAHVAKRIAGWLWSFPSVIEYGSTLRIIQQTFSVLCALL